MMDSDRSGSQLSVYDVLEGGRVPLAGERDASPEDSVDLGRICAWCAGRIPARSRRDAKVCGVVCRKRLFRFRRAVDAGRVPEAWPAGGTRPARLEQTSRRSRILAGRVARFAYADPPYPGKAGYYPEQTEVDHRELIAELEAGFPDGWALSTSAAALRDVLSMCPASTRVCAWRRRTRPTKSKRPLSAWEPLLVHGGRELPTARPQEVLDALDYRGRYDTFPGALIGMKPPEFAVWMFGQLGACAGDELVDVFPGSGAIGRAWDLYTSPGPTAGRDASLPAAGDLGRLS